MNTKKHFLFIFAAFEDVIVRIFKINIIIIMVHVIYRADFSKRKVNVMVVTL